VAVEIDLPDQTGRERLLALYGRSLPLRLTEAQTREIVERTEGVTASFVKELLRRAMLEALQENPANPIVTASHAGRALDDLLDAGQQLTRSLLGVGTDPEALAAGGGAGGLPPRVGHGRATAYVRTTHFVR
jgi:ATP-dependent 26S proteasome regulatory subunit